jgi:hypothetical protein
MSIVKLDPPDFRTVSEFRKRHLKRLAGVFKQPLRLCEQAGLAKFDHMALDGTKIKANSSKHKAMSYARVGKRAAELEAEVERWLSAAEAADAEEDRAFARDRSGEELRDWIADKQRRGREDPGGEGRTGGRSESGRGGQGQSAGRGRADALLHRRSGGRLWGRSLQSTSCWSRTRRWFSMRRPTRDSDIRSQNRAIRVGERLSSAPLNDPPEGHVPR